MLANVKTPMIAVVVLFAPLVVSDLPTCRELLATGAGCKCGSTVCAAGLNCAWQSSKGFHCKLYEEECEDLWDNCSANKAYYCDSYHTIKQKRECAKTCGPCQAWRTTADFLLI